MRFIGLILLSSFLFSLTGCAYIYAQRDDIDEIIEKWVTEKEYAKALNTLSSVKPTHPKYLLLMLRKKEIVIEAEKFTIRSINQAKFFMSANKWDDAYTIYKFSLDKLPNNKKLEDSYTEYLQKRTIYIDKLEFKLLVSKAEQMAKDLPVQKKNAIAKIEDNNEKEKHQDLIQQAQQISDILYKCAETALEQGDLNKASYCINLAKKLEPSKDINTLLEIVSKDINEIKKKALQYKQKQKQKKQLASKIIIKEFHAAYQKGDLITANKKMTRLLSLNKDDYEINKLKIELQQTINKKVQSGIESGRLLYSKGDIQLALEKWETLLKLVPDNKELLAHIDRAERVLRNLRKLTNKESAPAIQPPIPVTQNGS